MTLTLLSVLRKHNIYNAGLARCAAGVRVEDQAGKKLPRSCNNWMFCHKCHRTVARGSWLKTQRIISEVSQQPGVKIFLISLTVSHQKSDSLQRVVDDLLELKDEFIQGLSCFGIDSNFGSFNWFEPSFSIDNGFHPHFHFYISLTGENEHLFENLIKDVKRKNNKYRIHRVEHHSYFDYMMKLCDQDKINPDKVLSGRTASIFDMLCFLEKKPSFEHRVQIEKAIVQYYNWRSGKAKGRRLFSSMGVIRNPGFQKKSKSARNSCQTRSELNQAGAAGESSPLKPSKPYVVIVDHCTQLEFDRGIHGVINKMRVNTLMSVLRKKKRVYTGFRSVIVGCYRLLSESAEFNSGNGKIFSTLLRSDLERLEMASRELHISGRIFGAGLRSRLLSVFVSGLTGLSLFSKTEDFRIYHSMHRLVSSEYAQSAVRNFSRFVTSLACAKSFVTSRGSIKDLLMQNPSLAYDSAVRFEKTSPQSSFSRVSGFVPPALVTL